MRRRPWVSRQTRLEHQRRREARVLYWDRVGFVLCHLPPVLVVALLVVWVWR